MQLLAQMPEPPKEPVDPPAETDGVLSQVVGIGLAAVILFTVVGLIICWWQLSHHESDFGRVNMQVVAQVQKWLVVLVAVACFSELINVLFFWKPL